MEKLFMKLLLKLGSRTILPLFFDREEDDENHFDFLWDSLDSLQIQPGQNQDIQQLQEQLQQLQEQLQQLQEQLQQTFQQGQNQDIQQLQEQLQQLQEQILKNKAVFEDWEYVGPPSQKPRWTQQKIREMEERIDQRNSGED